MRLNTKQRTQNLVLTALLVIFIAWAVYSEVVTYRPWKKYQREFKEIELTHNKGLIEDLRSKRDGIKGEEALEKHDKQIAFMERKIAGIKNRPVKITQNWLIQFKNEADRCVTCHQAVEKPGYENQTHPFRTHSGDYLKHHPVQKFGCINCHDGEGHALTVEDGHGEAENWLSPLLKGSYSQASCGKCHFVDDELPLDAELAGGEKFMMGWALYKENNCLGCHKNSLYERPKRVAPVLTDVGVKVNKPWIKKWIKDPKSYLPKTKMPNFKLPDESVEIIAAYILSLAGDKKIEEPKAHKRLGNNAAIKNGKALVKKLGCQGCHTIEGEGGEFGPDLSDIASKTTPDFLFYWIKDPKVHQPDAPMPKLRVPDNEIQDIVAYLSTLNKGEIKEVTVLADMPLDEKIKKGRALLKDTGCTGCHEIGKFPLGFNAPPHDGIGSKRPDLLDWGNQEKFVEGTHKHKPRHEWIPKKIQDPRQFATETIISKMPNFGFTDEEAEALTTFLLSFTAETYPKEHRKQLLNPDTAEMRGRKFLEDKNCQGCHKIGGDKKAGAMFGRDNKFQVGPELTDEGKKVRPEWLFSFLSEPYRIRPMQEARMPYFRMSGEEITTAIEYLAVLSGIKEPYAAAVVKKKETYIEDIEEGEKLYTKELACLGCHTFEGKGGFIGPEHTDMASRLKREWIESWLKDPQAMQPDVRMPKFEFKGKDLEHLTDYLMTMGRERFLAVQ